MEGQRARYAERRPQPVSERPTDPLDELRHADPVRGAPAPSTSKARVWARIQEVNMTTTTPPSRRLAPWAAGMASIAAAGVLAVTLFTGGSTPRSPTDEPGPGIGACVETYSLETLGNRDFAFDGSVTGVDGDEVTFAINEAFVDDLGEMVTLTATGMTGAAVTSAGGPALAAGERYLVAGDDEFVWACGFTQPYDEAVAAEWAEATQ